MHPLAPTLLSTIFLLALNSCQEQPKATPEPQRTSSSSPTSQEISSAHTTPEDQSDVPSVPLRARDITTWPKASAIAFGCMLDKEFGSHDPAFNCSTKGPVDFGDPCTATEAYTKGPAFPDTLVAKIHPNLQSLEIAWEHGEIQAITLTFKTIQSKAAIARLLQATLEPDPTRNTLVSADLQECVQGQSCLVLQGFEHMGAGEVDCGN